MAAKELKEGIETSKAFLIPTPPPKKVSLSNATMVAPKPNPIRLIINK